MDQNNNNPQIDDHNNLTFCPSFNCYTTSSSPSSSSAAAAIKISNSLVVPDEDHEFNFVIEEDDNTVYPLFNQNCETLQSLFITEREDDRGHDTSSSDEEEEENEGENERGAVFCVWKGKSDTSSSSSVALSKCKKSRSTGSGSGSGSKRWRIRDYLLRRSNSEGKEPNIMLVSNKKVVEKVKRNSVEGGVSIGRSKPSVHEMFYVQNRAKSEEGKRRSYLPYRQGLVGFFTSSNVNVSGKGKSFPF